MKAKYFFWICLVLIGVGLVIAVFPIQAAPASQESPNFYPTEDDYLTQTWKTGLWGSGIGASGMTAFDIDGDGQTEVVLGGGYMGSDNRFWYVLSYDSPSGNYVQEWLSKEYTASEIYRLVVADPAGGGQYRIYVALSDATVEVYDAATRQWLETFSAPYTITAMCFADVDGDSDQEIVASGEGGLAVLDALTYQVEWQTGVYGSEDVAVANVDADPALEIVTRSRVIDGVTQVLEWDYPSTFGALVRLADIDADNMAEIIAVLDYYTIYAYDADTQAAKWNLPVVMDVQSLYVGDVDNDTVQEVVVGDGQWGYVHAYDSLTLLEEWSIANPETGVNEMVFADPDQDGLTEVLWGAGWTSTGPDYLYVGDTISETIEWQSTDTGGPLSAVDTGDVDNDGSDEIVMVSYDSEDSGNAGIIFVYDAETYALEWQSEPLLGGLARPGAEAVALADVDEDGVLEIVIATAVSYDGVILAYDGVSHGLDWQTNIFDGAIFSALAIADTDNDGHLEVIGGQEGATAGTEDIYVRIFDGLSGTEEWHTAFLGEDSAVYAITAGDSDSDGNPEILFTVDGDQAYLYDGVYEYEEWRSSATTGLGVLMANVDQDSQLELLLGTSNGSVDIYDGQTYTQEGSWSLTSAPVNALRIEDVDLDGAPDLVLCEDSRLAVYDPLTQELVARSEVLGSATCNHGHLAVGNIGGNSRIEAVVGSNYALYVFSIDALAFNSSLEVSQPLTVPGAPLTYTLQIQNLDEPPLSAVVTGTLPADTSYIPGSLWGSAGTWQLVGDVIQWSVNLADDTPATLTYGVTVDGAVTDGTVITHTAYFSASGFTVPRTVSTIIDALPPETTISQPLPAEIVSGSSYTIAGDSFDATSGVDTVEVNIGGSGWELASGTAQWDYLWTLPLTDSLVTIQARATDNVGQTEAPGASVTVYVDNLSPYILSTSPADGSLEIPLSEPLVITFSEPIVPDTLAVTCQPTLSSVSVTVSPDGRTFTLEHADFEQHADYLCTVEQAQDGAGHGLIPGSAPNPWEFSTIQTINPVESVVISGPTVAEPGELIILYAQTSPLTATIPIVYVWDTENQLPYTHTAGLTDRAYFRWNTPGVKIVTLDIFNPASTASDIFEIYIREPFDVYIPFITKGGGATYTGQADLHTVRCEPL